MSFQTFIFTYRYTLHSQRKTFAFISTTTYLPLKRTEDFFIYLYTLLYGYNERCTSTIMKSVRVITQLSTIPQFTNEAFVSVQRRDVTVHDSASWLVRDKVINSGENKNRIIIQGVFRTCNVNPIFFNYIPG